MDKMQFSDLGGGHGRNRNNSSSHVGNNAESSSSSTSQGGGNSGFCNFNGNSTSGGGNKKGASAQDEQEDEDENMLEEHVYSSKDIEKAMDEVEDEVTSKYEKLLSNTKKDFDVKMLEQKEHFKRQEFSRVTEIGHKTQIISQQKQELEKFKKELEDSKNRTIAVKQQLQQELNATKNAHEREKLGLLLNVTPQTRTIQNSDKSSMSFTSLHDENEAALPFSNASF